jgi:hypothetical protein
MAPRRTKVANTGAKNRLRVLLSFVLRDLIKYPNHNGRIQYAESFTRKAVKRKTAARIGNSGQQELFAQASRSKSSSDEIPIKAVTTVSGDKVVIPLRIGADVTVNRRAKALLVLSGRAAQTVIRINIEAIIGHMLDV